jgi:cytidylate kinase
MQIAIDGPSGSGKSTISKILAEKYNLVYLDTGAMYRAAAWLQLETSMKDADLVAFLATVDIEFYKNGREIYIRYPHESRRIEMNLTELIRTPAVTAHVSKTSAIKEVRAIMTDKQREIALGTDVIMDGRDIGTVVLPNAEIKYFLTASAEERASRRTKEWQAKGTPADYAQVLEDIKKRDELDSTRDTAPLTQAADAVLLDTTGLTIDEVCGIIDAAIEGYKE